MPLRFGRRAPDRLLERLIGGRAWIAVIAFALIGIVAMQLWVVKLGVGIGRALEHTQLLQQENATLASEDSALSSAERIERLALAKGMVPASPAALHFDTLRGPLDARLAAAALAKPIQAPATSSTPVGATASTEANTTPVGATASTEANTAPVSTEASAGSTGAEATATQTSASETPSTAAQTSTSETPSTETPSTGTASPATAPVPPAESTEAAGAPADAGGGTQAPGG
jgi:cell division protein FtsL